MWNLSQDVCFSRLLNFSHKRRNVAIEEEMLLLKQSLYKSSWVITVVHSILKGVKRKPQHHCVERYLNLLPIAWHFRTCSAAWGFAMCWRAGVPQAPADALRTCLGLLVWHGTPLKTHLSMGRPGFCSPRSNGLSFSCHRKGKKGDRVLWRACDGDFCRSLGSSNHSA